MKTEIEEKETYKNIDAASENFKKIVDNVNNPKFEHIETWLYKTSKNFCKENSSQKNTSYPRFDYGTIIKVDFGINTGSELSNPHFAIVLERFDSTKSDSITILPLTSQKKNYNLPLSDLIIDEFVKRLKKHNNRIKEEIDTLKVTGCTIESIENKANEIILLDDMIKYYSNYAKNSYACINQITTISKKKIIRPKNKFDIIGRAKCSSNTMKIISNEIIKKYTNIKPSDENHE